MGSEMPMLARMMNNDWYLLFFLTFFKEGSSCNVQNAKALCTPRSIMIMFDHIMPGNVQGVANYWTRQFSPIGQEGIIS